MLLNKILGEETFNNLILHNNEFSLSKIKKSTGENKKILYYDCSRNIREFINLEKLSIDLCVFVKDCNGKYKYINLYRFSKLKILYLKNIFNGTIYNQNKNNINDYEDNFFDYLFSNMPVNLEILILEKTKYDTFEHIFKFLKNLPLGLKYIIFIDKNDSEKRVYYSDKLKLPFGCKIIHCFYSPLTYYNANNIQIIDEYEEET